MNDLELESRLRSVRVPERPAGYWDDFPSRIRVQLRRERSASVPGHVWRFRLTWAFDFALTAALVFISVQYHPLRTASAAMLQHEQYYHRQLARLDTGMHRLMLNTDGMGYLLAEAN